MTEISTAPAPTATAPISNRRATPRRIGLAATAVAAATATAFVGLTVTSGPGGLGPKAFAVSHLPGDTIAIKVVNTEASAAQMTRQLRDQGVNVTVDTVTTTPQLVGTWISAGFSADVPESLSQSIASQMHGYVATIELPAVFPGTINLDVGRPTPAGEEPTVAGMRNALAPGGRLFCDRLSGVRPSIAEQRLTAQGYTVHWVDGTRSLYSQTVSAPPAGTRVSAAFIFDFDRTDLTKAIADPRDVNVTVISPQDRRFLPQLWLGFAPSQQTTPQTIDYSSCPS